MDRTVELINQWAAFVERYPEAELEDFYRYKVVEKKQDRKQKLLENKSLTPKSDQTLISVLSRLYRLYLEYAEIAIKGTSLNFFEEFLFLSTIEELQQPRKTDVVTYNISRLSSGLLIINRLKKYEYVVENEDEVDKRSKRLLLTQQGQLVLHHCYKQLDELSQLFFDGLAEEDAQLCIQLLKDIDLKFSQLWPSHKGKTFDEIRLDLWKRSNSSGKPYVIE